MSGPDPLRLTRDRAWRLASGDARPYLVRLADALDDLERTLAAERDAAERLKAYGAALGFINNRTRSEYVRVTGEQP